MALLPPLVAQDWASEWGGASVLYSDRRAVQAIGRIDRGADQNEGLNGTAATARRPGLVI